MSTGISKCFGCGTGWPLTYIIDFKDKWTNLWLPKMNASTSNWVEKFKHNYKYFTNIFCYFMFIGEVIKG